MHVRDFACNGSLHRGLAFSSPRGARQDAHVFDEAPAGNSRLPEGGLKRESYGAGVRNVSNSKWSSRGIQYAGRAREHRGSRDESCLLSLTRSGLRMNETSRALPCGKRIQ
jgi:hypothetical protein